MLNLGRAPRGVTRNSRKRESGGRAVCGELHVPTVIRGIFAESGPLPVFLSVWIWARDMKAFGHGFKLLHDTGMGPASGMSEGAGSDFEEMKSFARSDRHISGKPTNREFTGHAHRTLEFENRSLDSLLSGPR